MVRECMITMYRKLCILVCVVQLALVERYSLAPSHHNFGQMRRKKRQPQRNAFHRVTDHHRLHRIIIYHTCTPPFPPMHLFSTDRSMKRKTRSKFETHKIAHLPHPSKTIRLLFMRPKLLTCCCVFHTIVLFVPLPFPCSHLYSLLPTDPHPSIQQSIHIHN